MYSSRHVHSGKWTSRLSALLEQLARCRLGPDSRIPLMQLLHPPGHRPLVAGEFALAVEETALESQLDLAMDLVNAGADDEEAVGASQALVARRVSAAHGDVPGGLLDDLEVIGELGALIVSALSELLLVPELVLSLGASPLVLQVFLLNGETWR